MKVYQKLSNSPTCHTGDTTDLKLAGHTHTAPTKNPWGGRSCGVPAAHARGEEAVLTWGPPVKVNFELATPNSVHDCTLARLTWRRMKKGTGVHCARAVHVQVVCALKNSHVPTGQTGSTTDPNSQVTFILCQLKIHWGCPPGGV